MKVKMLEHFQGTGQPTLSEGGEFVVDAKLGAWLIEHRKAVEIEEPKPEPEPQETAPKNEEVAEKPARARKSRGRTKK